MDVEIDFKRGKIKLKGKCLVMSNPYMKEFKEAILEFHNQDKSAHQLSLECEGSTIVK